jgi:hypothetical protein
MATPLTIRIGATTEFGLIVAGNTGWFADYLPIAGSPAPEAIVVIGTAVLVHELVEVAHEIARNLRGRRRRKGSPPPDHVDRAAPIQMESLPDTLAPCPAHNARAARPC